ncbi:MAG: hypothetical protein ACTSUF_09795, partial [Candidatus Heimdallarchaeaceae archaeon]
MLDGRKKVLETSGRKTRKPLSIAHKKANSMRATSTAKRFFSVTVVAAMVVVMVFGGFVGVLPIIEHSGFVDVVPMIGQPVSAALSTANIEVKATYTEPQSGTGSWTLAAPDIITGGSSVPSNWIGDEVNEHITYTPQVGIDYTSVAVYGVPSNPDSTSDYRDYIVAMLDVMLSEGMGRLVDEGSGWPWADYDLKLYYYEDGLTSQKKVLRYDIKQKYYDVDVNTLIYYEPQSNLDVNRFYDKTLDLHWNFLVVPTYLYNIDDTKYTGASAQLAREYLTGINEFDTVESASGDCAAVIPWKSRIVFIVGHYEKDLAAVTAGIPSMRGLLRKPATYDLVNAPTEILSAEIFGENLVSPPTPTIKRLEYKNGVATFKETGIVTGTPASGALAAWALAVEIFNIWSQYKAIQTYYEACDLLKSMKIHVYYALPESSDTNNPPPPDTNDSPTVTASASPTSGTEPLT